MMHPFSSIQYPYRWHLLIALVLLTATFALKLRSQGEQLVTATSPNGMISFQMSWTKAKAEAILNSWKNSQRIARKQLKCDNVFLLFYPLLFSLACGMLADSTHNTVRATIGHVLSWAVLFTGPFDAVENYALLDMLQRGASGIMAKTAGSFAGAKYLLLILTLGYILTAAALQSFERDS